MNGVTIDGNAMSATFTHMNGEFKGACHDYVEDNKAILLYRN